MFAVGGFQPMHKDHHKSLWGLVDSLGSSNVFIATTVGQKALVRISTFDEKAMIQIGCLGIPNNNILIQHTTMRTEMYRTIKIHKILRLVLVFSAKNG